MQYDGRGTGGQECSEAQEEQQEETRTERDMQEDLTRRPEEYGAAGEEEGAQRTGWRSTVARGLRAGQVGRGALAVAMVQEGPTAEERRRVSLEGAAIIRSRTEADMQFRGRAAVGLEAAKRDKMGRKGGGGGAGGTVRVRPGRVKRALPGPPYIKLLVNKPQNLTFLCKLR